jgi:penicillin-binding protein 1C
LAAPLTLRPAPPLPGAEHWVRTILRRTAPDAAEIRTPLDLPLQREVEKMARSYRRVLAKYGGSALSILVVDSRTADVLAYVGSPDFHSDQDAGQNDGVHALRQPGSTLKPFLYAAAIDLLGWSAGTLLEDGPYAAPGGGIPFEPRNFDRKFRGQVSLERALANSLNVPAVRTLIALGVDRSLSVLHDFGFESLRQSPGVYGAALALGDGEVSLLELVAAYRALAADGVYRPLRFTTPGSTDERRACSARAAQQVARILANNALRVEAFGAGGPLEFSSPVAVKTGTSTGYRDAWTVGFDEDVTVGVWVGNFDGHPLRDATGAASASPLFHQVMLRAQALTGRRRSAE